MEAISFKGSSKRKPAFTMKVKLTSKKRSQTESDSDNYSDSNSKHSTKKEANSDKSDVDSIPDLPEGTVVVKPEAVKEKKPRFSGPEFSKAQNLDVVNCTACGRQINPNISGAAKKHPDLKVLVCRKCYSYYRSGKIEQDEDGLDEQCRWCGEGGRLLGCDFCHNAFCKSCIIRNFSRAELTKVMADDGSKWKCYVCDPSKLKKLLQECEDLFKKIDKEKLKAKIQSKNTDSSRKAVNSKGPRSDGKSISGTEATKMHSKDILSLSGIAVGATDLVETVSQLLGVTNGFQTMLEVLKADLVACGDVEHSTRDLNRGTKTLETGLRQYLKSITNILHSSSSSKCKNTVENGETTGDESIVSNGFVSLSDDDETSRKAGSKQASKISNKIDNTEIPSSKKEHKGQIVEVKDDLDSEYENLEVAFEHVTETKSSEEKNEKENETSGSQKKNLLGDNENEAAQLELLKELAEEMCKEQKERKEHKQEEKEAEKSEEKSDGKNDSSMDESDSDLDSDDVSSSDLLMSSDGDFESSRNLKKKKDRRQSRHTNETTEERKKRKKKEKKENREGRKREKKDSKKYQKGKESVKKIRSEKAKSDDSEADLDKEIAKFEQVRSARKKKRKQDEGSDIDSRDSENNFEKEMTEKNSTKSKDVIKKGKKKKDLKETQSSSSDDENDDANADDDIDEEEEENGILKNGKTEVAALDNGASLENEIAKETLMAELEENDDGNDEDNEDDDSDSDIQSKKKDAKKSGKKKSDSKEKDCQENEKNSEDEDSDTVPKSRKRIRSKLLDAKISESDSDIEKKSRSRRKAKDDTDSEEIVAKKKSKKRKDDSDFALSDSDVEKKKKKKRKRRKGKKRKLASDSESSSSSSEPSDSEVSLDTSEEERREKLKEERKKKAKRRRIKQQEDTSDEDKGKKDDSTDFDDDDDDENKSPDKSGRKNIRKIKSDKKLTDETKKARKAEEARRKRVSDRQKEFNHIVTIEDEVSECPITTQLILEMDKEKKKPLLEVNKKLIRKLKPHQVEACQFIFDCLCESVDRIQKKEGSGCILAHCMGLGKTLSVISFVHTMLRNPKLTKMTTCLIVCPLNTVINWRNEWNMWFDENEKLDIYEMSSIKQNWSRADYLKDWHEEGGIMILGYEMYRNLTQSARIKNKKLKAIFMRTLVDPGPDLVVCDEGHILKNDASAISQAMNKIRTRRRIVLTGTPLQNNLVEYHCMTSFVKPNLLGTRKEFLNRFVNPITNGQHSDSTSYDVKVMGRRAHVLHEMLAGCVQRRDYSALTKFLPPKFEYVISVRLSPKQIELYQKYLDVGGICNDGMSITTKGARLFADYQNLMKIWTHPWVLKLSEIRAEQRMKYDDSEDSFIDNSTSEGEASSTGSQSDSERSKSESEESVEAGTSTGRTRRSRRGKPPPEDSDKEEVVKDWKTRSRGGEGDYESDIDDGPKPVSSEWWAEYVKEEDESDMTLSGKLMLLFEILRMCEEIGDKVLIFSQSLLSLDIIEYFLDYIDRQAQEEAQVKAKAEQEEKKESEEKKENSEEKKENGEGKKENGEGKKEDAKNDEDELVQTEFGKSWTKGADYFRMDGSTSPQLRSHWADVFNDPENFRARLFLISTRAGSLGINLVAANRVIIFDASWNPSHDVQSIFRVYRFGQLKPCYVYRFLAQGTMEEKIYERQVTKQSLSQRVVDEHQIDRHFSASDLSELYNFMPDRLDDPNREKVVHSLPKDVLLAELLKSKDTFIHKFHEHDSLLENRREQELSEEDKKAAWEEYENERKGMSNRVAQASTASGMGMFSPDNVMQIVQMVKMRFPNLPPDMFQAQVQAILQQQIMFQQSLQKQQIEQQRMMEMQRLHRIQQNIRSQQRQINSMTRPSMVSLLGARSVQSPGLQMHNPPQSSALRGMLLMPNTPGLSGGKSEAGSRSSTPNNPPPVIDLSNS